MLGRRVVHYNPYFRSHRALREPQSGRHLYDANFQTASYVGSLRLAVVPYGIANLHKPVSRQLAIVGNGDSSLMQQIEEEMETIIEVLEIECEFVPFDDDNPDHPSTTE